MRSTKHILTAGTLTLMVGALLTGITGAKAQPPAAPSVPTTPPAASATSAAPAAQPGTPSGIQFEATPALWKVKGTHGTVYLFGSVHIMKKEVHWQTPKVKDAFAASDTLYLEIAKIDIASQMALQPLVMQLGMDPTHALSTKIPQADVVLLDGLAKKLGQPGEQIFEPMQPWFVSLTVGLLPSMKAGYDPTSGIDMTLNAQALAAKKPVKGFETAEAQLHLLADAPLPEQVAMLHEAIVDQPKGAGQLDAIVADWTRGDVEKLAALENDDLKRHPELYDRLLVKRNQGFAHAIAALLKDPTTGTVFVAVGAAHLAGPDSVQKMLEKQGFTIVREE